MSFLLLISKLSAPHFEKKYEIDKATAYSLPGLQPILRFHSMSVIWFYFFFCVFRYSLNTVCFPAASPSSSPSSPKLPSATQSPSSSGGGGDNISISGINENDNSQKVVTGNGLDRQSSGNDNEHTPIVESTTETVPTTAAPTAPTEAASTDAEANHVTDNNNGKVPTLTNGSSNDNDKRSVAVEATLAAGKAAGNNNDKLEELYDIPVGEFWTLHNNNIKQKLWWPLFMPPQNSFILQIKIKIKIYFNVRSHLWFINKSSSTLCFINHHRQSMLRRHALPNWIQNMIEIVH